MKTENLWSLLNLLSLFSSFALLIIGIKICLEKRNPSIIKEKTNNILTGSNNRIDNMFKFSEEALNQFLEIIRN